MVASGAFRLRYRDPNRMKMNEVRVGMGRKLIRRSRRGKATRRSMGGQGMRRAEKKRNEKEHVARGMKRSMEEKK